MKIILLAVFAITMVSCSSTKQAAVAQGKLYGMQDAAYFIDIGIPADFEKANSELNDIKTGSIQ